MLVPGKSLEPTFEAESAMKKIFLIDSLAILAFLLGELLLFYSIMTYQFWDPAFEKNIFEIAFIGLFSFPVGRLICRRQTWAFFRFGMFYSLGFSISFYLVVLNFYSEKIFFIASFFLLMSLILFIIINKNDFKSN
jgi:hypothetical protein